MLTLHTFTGIVEIKDIKIRYEIERFNSSQTNYRFFARARGAEVLLDTIQAQIDNPEDILEIFNLEHIAEIALRNFRARKGKLNRPISVTSFDGGSREPSTRGKSKKDVIYL